MKIAIVGAGITGLSAALALSKEGHTVTVFERAAVPGGLGTYKQVSGEYIESFYHHFFESDTFIINLAKELGVAKFLTFYKAKTGIYSGGKIYPFSTVGNLFGFKELSFFNRFRCGVLVAFLKFYPSPLTILDRISAEKFICYFAGKKVYDVIWAPLLEGKFSSYAKTVPALWLWGRIRDRSPKLGYFKGSVKILFDSMILAIQKRGSSVELSSVISSITTTKKTVSLDVNNETRHFDKVIITTVSPITEQLTNEFLSKSLRKKLKVIDHLGAICVILTLSRSVQSQYWVNICEKDAKVLVVIEHTNMIPKKYYGGRTIIYLANYIHRSREDFQKTDAEIIAQYMTVLKKLNPKFSKKWVVDASVARVPRAQTIFRLGALFSKPAIKTSNELIYMVNIDQMYPHDRNLNQGVELGFKAAAAVSRT